MSVGQQSVRRGGHGPVDSWIHNGQAPMETVPFKVGPNNKAGTAFRVFGLWFLTPIAASLGALALAQSKA
jgi:hypothetical protein